MWSNLFYDKYAGDHHFQNSITKFVSINDLEDGSFLYFTGKDALDLFNSKFPGNYTIPENIEDCNLYKIHLYVKNIEGIENIYTVISVNNLILENLIKEKTIIPYVDFLKTLCRYHLSYNDENQSIMNPYYHNSNSINVKIQQNIKYIVDKANIPIDYTIDDRINDPSEITVKLFEYQKCSVNWMIQKELTPTKISYNLNKEISIGNVYFDLYNHNFFLNDDRKCLKFNGGGLIDEVGLGKTLQMITLAIKNQPDETTYIRPEIDETKLFSRATLVLCPNQLCGQWIRELQKMVSKDFDPIIVQLLTKRDFDKYTYQDFLDADFVIVSYTFLDNKIFTLPWSSKLSKLKNYHKQIWSNSDYANVKILFENMGKKLIENPSEALTQNQPFIQLIHWHRIAVDEFHEVYSNSKYVYIKNLLRYLNADYKWIISATPFIDNKSLYNICDYLTNYKNIDGENILTNELFVDYLSSECFRRNTKKSVAEEHTLPPIEEEIRWLKFTHTERMMYNAYLANPNNDKFSVYLRQLCCHPQLAEETKQCLSNCKTLQDIEKMMVNHYKNEVDIVTEKLNKILERIKKINKKIKKLEKKQKKRQMKLLGLKNEDISDSDSSDLDSESDDEDISLILIGLENYDNVNYVQKPSITMDNLKESLKKLEFQEKEINKELDGKRTTFDFFNNVVNRIKKTVTKKDESNPDTNVMNILSDQLKENQNSTEDDETCGICLDEIPENDVGVTKCGHIFCYECLKICISKYHNCPYCKKQLKDNEIYILSYERKKKIKELKNPEDKLKEELINEVGTKLSNLILFLKEKNEHTILFSQWDDLLRRVGRILNENGIKNVFCKGNCYQRDKAIREFNDDEKIKVIMLSSESTASGTNLTKASQVILLDPIFGNYKYRKDQERQAIGRAHRLGQKRNIKVIRFIIKNTVEEEIYEINQEEDKKYIDSKDFTKLDEIEIA
ncbi:SNF2 helicase with zinc finger RING-type domain [uncultured virus]|nr:SNF2 helicase with zinc finger RING-type domain [uncultured virus]